MDLGLIVLMLIFGGIAGFELGQRFPARDAVIRAIERLDSAEVGQLVELLERRWGISVTPPSIRSASSKPDDPASTGEQ